MENYIFLGAVGLMVLSIGLILLFVWHSLRMRQQNRMKSFLARDLIHKVKKLMVEAIGDSMDIMPEKIMETKKIIDEGGM